MQNTEHLRQASFGRILDFTEKNPLETPIAAAATLITELTTTKTAIDTLATAQDLAFGTVHGAVVDRKQLKKDLVSFLVGLGETARALDPVAHPGLAAEMRLGRATNSYAALLSRARAMHIALVAAKAAFVAYGATATVDADLLALINALEAATQRKNNGKAIHIGGRAGIAALCKVGVVIVRKLDAILSRVYKTDPVKLAAWKAARRVQRNPVPAQEPAAPAQPPADGSGSGI
jgi:hypothetical protein